ncbi:MAG: EamA family transporter [Spirochaetota bacterium]
MRQPSRLHSETLIVVATVIGGGTFFAIRAGLDYVSPLLMISVRFLVSFALLIPVLARATCRWWRRVRMGALLGVVILAGVFLSGLWEHVLHRRRGDGAGALPRRSRQTPQPSP